jgi:hypothetical protein
MPNTLTFPVNHAAVAPATKTTRIAAKASATARLVAVLALFTVMPVPFVVGWPPRDASYRPFELDRQQFKLIR